MSGAESTTEVTPTGRYEDHSLVPLGGHEVHKMVKFCLMAGAGSEFSLQAALSQAG